MKQFRFQTLEIWEDAMTIAESLLDISDEPERQKYFRFADQMRGAAMSMSNNIAEGSGSASKKVFARYLDIARGSVFENVNMLILFNRRKYIPEHQTSKFLCKLEILSQRITHFKKSLCTNPVLHAPGPVPISFYNEPNEYQLMNTNRTKKMDKNDNKKEWTSPRLSELPVEETNQLNPPDVDDQQIS